MNMGTHLLKILILIFLPLTSIGQVAKMFIVDSIPIISRPNQKLNNLKKENIFSLQMITDRDSLKSLGLKKTDTGIFIITNKYHDRPESIKKIPSVNIMEQKGDRWFLIGKDSAYTGPFINYYLSGDKLGEGTFINGRLDGKRSMYFENQQLKLVRHYRNGIEHGWEEEFYQDGTLKQHGSFIDGKEDGKWEMYYPNGQLKQLSFFDKGKLINESTSYYSTGMVKVKEKIVDGVPTPNEEKKKVYARYSEGFKNAQLGNLKAAISSYSKCLDLDPNFAEGYFARGTAYLNNMEFEKARQDFNKAIKLEPYYIEAYANRAFCLIRKHQIYYSKKSSKKRKREQPMKIPDEDLSIICGDLEMTISLGNTSQLILGAQKEFCIKESN